MIEQKNKELVAFHEGGHAIVAMFTPGLIMIIIIIMIIIMIIIIIIIMMIIIMIINW